MRWWLLLPLLLAFPQDRDWEKLRKKLDGLAADDPAERAAVRESVKTIDRDSLIKGLRAKESREAAAIALGILGDEKCKDALVEMTKSKEAAIRTVAFEALGGIKPPEALLIKALGDEPRVAFAAARSLARTAQANRLWAIYREAAADNRIRTRLIAATLAVEELNAQIAAPNLAGALGDKEDAFVSALLLALTQMETVDALRANGETYAKLIRQTRTRKSLSEEDHRRAALLLIRAGIATDDDYVSMLTDTSDDLRARAIKALTPAEPAKKDVARWLAWLENDAIARDYGKLIESWIAKATGTDPGGDRAERLKVWNAWWVRHRETLFAESVSKAIESGVAFLRSRANKDRWMDRFGEAGLTALCAYTLLKSGVSANDAELTKTLAWLLKQPFDGPALEGGTYRTALLAMVLSEASTTWRRAKETDEDLGAKYKKRATEAANYLINVQRNGGGWNYGREGEVDNSNVQFAILGLRSAQNIGAKIPQATWKRSGAYLEKVQGADGGWGYATEAPYGSMTAAGLCGQLIARSSDKQKAPADLLTDKDIARSLKWLDDNWSMEGHLYKNGGVGSGIGSAYYWLWSLERCCLVANVEKIGKHDWYREGAEYIIAKQGKTGEWTGPEELADHCFALLFLKRAYIPVATEGHSK